MHEWIPVSGTECAVSSLIIVAKEFDPQVLSLANNHGLSRHLGIKRHTSYVMLRFSPRPDVTPITDGEDATTLY